MSEAEFAVGIDLGTTNCALAEASAGGDEAPLALPLPQVVSPGEVASRGLLPSFLFFPAPGQFADEALALPWYPGASDVAGTFARAQGSATPARLVASAKSWLSHAGVDRRAEILPWEAPEDVPRVSPLQASARYLAHLRAAWERQHPDRYLAEQDVVLTVPASFDAVARELTIEAATLAGFDEPPVLLEEPQAALYDWVAQRGAQWRDDVSVGDVILVVDIGGGTTDFSLIAVREDEGNLALERIAVGEHILLGGDNIDLALAYTVRARIEDSGKELSDWQTRGLTHSCRVAKETLLRGASEAQPLSIASRGSRLVGGTIRAELLPADIDTVVLDGFFPQVGAEARPQAAARMGLQTLGLPYASDAAVTRHLAAFLARAGEHSDGRSFMHPTAVLFNGGVTRSPAIRARILQVLGAWISAESGTAPKVLEGVDPELAVARGAAYYARARRSGGLRIRGGIAQSYYIGIERAELAVPGVAPRVDTVCVAPFGLEEGSEVQLERAFGIVLGEPVSFRFFGSSSRHEDEVGASAKLRDVSELPPIETILDGEAGEVAHVKLVVRVTEVGTLEIQAVDAAKDRRWNLSFNLSSKVRGPL